MKIKRKTNSRLLRKLSFLTLFLLTSIGLSAQITIEEDVLSGIYNIEYKYVLFETSSDLEPQLSVNLGRVGANQTWDFSGFEFNDSTVYHEVLFPVSPDDPILSDPQFSSSTFIVKTTLPPTASGQSDTIVLYRYRSLMNEDMAGSNMLEYGSATILDFDSDGNIDTLLQWFSPPKLLIPFPVTSNSMWTDSSSTNQLLDDMPFVSSIFIDTTMVEGWGMLHTPDASAQALRIRNKQKTLIPGTPIESESSKIDFVPADNSFYISIVLDEEVVFYSTRSRTDGTSSFKEVPKFDFHLAQNYPNPFEVNTKIEFSIPNYTFVKIRVLDIKGNTVEVLTNRNYPSGTHFLDWFANSSPPGIYILEMRIGNQIQHRMMNKIE